VFGEVLEDVLRGEAVIFQTAAGFDADKFLFLARGTRPEPARDGRRAQKRADLENAAVAHSGHVIDQHQHVDIEHRVIGRLHELMVQRLVVAIRDQAPHQLEGLLGLVSVVQSEGLWLGSAVQKLLG
jgi:hypothetical protein